ncbi:MAG: hypothetical protein RL354_2 [Planctomycetota bacterium]|jgi:hypothetical protein
MHQPVSITSILGQNQNISVTETIKFAVESLVTPEGLAAALAGATVLAFVLLWRKGPMLGAVLVVFLMTMMQLNDRWFDNTLIAPLQKIRDFAKFGTVVILATMSLGTVFAPPSTRSRLVSVALLAFFAFQTLYMWRLGIQNDLVRGGLGWITTIMLLLSVAIGLGRRVEDDAGFDRFVSIFGIASIIYIAANLLQLALGYRNVVAGNRLMGISGNAQLMAYICAIFLLTNVYLFARLPLGSVMRWVYGASIGILGLFVVWTGSRTGALCAATGMFAYFRLRIGSFALVAALGAAVLFAVASFFAESFEGVSRFLDAGNTRRDVWLQAWSEFQSAPLFGTIGLRKDEQVTTIESSYLATLSLLGITGAIVLMGSILSIATMLPRLAYFRWSGRVVPEQADLVIASISVVLVGSVFEGFFLGILSFAVVWLYALFVMAAYLEERATSPLPDQFESDEVEAEYEDPDDVASPSHADEAPARHQLL